MILALDPGTDESGWVRLDGQRILACGVTANDELLVMLQTRSNAGEQLVIEWIESYGMPVGKEIFDTVRWVGRFQQAWRDPEGVRFIPRRAVKLHLCNSPRAKDSNVRQALLDKFGPQGKKLSPGPTYGLKSHAWAALAVAITALETPCTT